MKDKLKSFYKKLMNNPWTASVIFAIYLMIGFGLLMANIALIVFVLNCSIIAGVFLLAVELILITQITRYEGD